MGQITLRDARAKDVVKFTRKAIPLKFVGFVAEDQETGELIGLGVIVHGIADRFYVCLEMTPRLRSMPVLMHKIGRLLVKAGSQVCPELYSIAKGDEPTSEPWLTRLGFKPTEERIGGERLFRFGG